VNAQKEDVLSIEWSTASDRRLIAVRIRRHGDADSVEGTIELVEQEWRLIEDVALGHGSRPHTPAELEALLATLRALSYRVRPIRIAAVDPHSGHVDLQLTASGERLAAWLLSQPANSGAAVNSVK
jgi:hypothetical protein